MGIIPAAQLGSAAKAIPLVGFGTAEYPFNVSDVKGSVLDAIEYGYRHFDTAAVYGSEKPLGEAVAKALRLGLIKSRNELFITSKLWIADAHRELVLPAPRRTLRNLGMEYVDLYLIHWPISLKPKEIVSPRNKEELLPLDFESVFPLNKEELLPLDFESVWKAMEECHDLGLAKSIGVSNFSSKKLQKLLSTARIPPAVNQVEMNPLWQQKSLREYLKANGILIVAYAPLGANRTPWGSSLVMDSEVLRDIARKMGKTVAQVCLRWVHEQGACLLVKSFDKGRMKENLEIFDWQLSPEDLAKIDQIPQHRGTTGIEYVSDKGPFKSTSDVWDGEA